MLFLLIPLTLLILKTSLAESIYQKILALEQLESGAQLPRNEGLACRYRHKGKRIIPVGSTFEFCDDDCFGDIFQLHYIDVRPLFPNIGDTWDLLAPGFFRKDLPLHSEWHVTVHNATGQNPTLLMDLKVPFCDIAGHVWQNGSLSCPPLKGDVVLTREDSLPSHLNEGDYTIKMDARTPEDQRIICLFARIRLRRHGNEEG